MPASVKQALERLGTAIFYVIMKVLGQRGGYLLLYPVVFCYVLFDRRLKTTTSPYLTKRFPDGGCWQLFKHRFRLILSFGRVLVDRGWLEHDLDADIRCDTIGREKLIEVVNEGKGLVLVTAHVGNWYSALTRLDFLPAKVHALMQYDESTDGQHPFEEIGGGQAISIINTDLDFGGMIEATAALQRGEVVIIMADRYIKGTSSIVDFMGKDARLPNSAYTLAACVGSPVGVFLAAKLSAKHFQVKVWDIFYPQSQHRENRQQMLDESCLKFGDCLEKYLSKYPYQWYNFYDFWDLTKKNTQS